LILFILSKKSGRAAVGAGSGEPAYRGMGVSAFRQRHGRQFRVYAAEVLQG
jgi:hypothetical protein